MAKQDGKGGLWPNHYKTQGDNRPDYVGEITITGITHKISGWINTNTGGGRPVINLVFNGEYKTPAVAPATPATPREVPATTMTDALHDDNDPFDNNEKIPF